MGLVQVAVRHLGSYIELVARAAAEYRASFLRRALYAAAALVAAVATLGAAWVTGLALLWNSPWRMAYCVGSVLAFLCTTVIFSLLVMKRPSPGHHARTLRHEAEQDLALLQEWQRSR